MSRPLIVALIVATSLSAFTACSKTPGEGLFEDPQVDQAPRAAVPRAEATAVETPPKETGPTAGWIDFEGPRGTYKARFPGRPTTTEGEKVPTDAGEQTMSSALYESASGNRAFVAAIIDVTVKEGQQFDAKLGLAGGATGMVTGMGATLDSSKDITVEGLAGKEMTFHGSVEGQSFKGVARIFVQQDPPRLWEVSAIVALGEDDSQMQPFVEAFVPTVNRAAPAAAAWVDYEAETYRVQFPKTPKAEDQPLDTALGARTMKSAMAFDGTLQAAFVSGWTDARLPKGDAFSVKGGLDGARDGILKQSGFTAGAEKEIALGDMVGREIVLVGKGKGPNGTDAAGIARIFVDAVSQRFYMLAVFGPPPLPEEAASKFFASFHPK